MARSIAKEITRQEPPAGGPEDADAEDEAGEASVDFEAEMHEFQAELGDTGYCASRSRATTNG